MANPRFKDRQLTLYLPTKEDLDRWRSLSKPYTLNHWVYLQVEKALEGEQQRRQTRTTTHDTDALQKENLDLRKENESLAAKLDHIRSKEVEDILERSSNSPMQLDKHVVDLLRSGGCWSSARLIKKLAQEPAPPEGMHAFRMDEADSKAAITPEFFSNSLSEILPLEVDVKAVERTLDALEQIGLVKKSWQGWKWDI